MLAITLLCSFTFKAQVGSIGQAGEKEGELYYPQAITGDGIKVYVSDLKNRVQIFDRALIYKGKIETSGKPVDLAIDKEKNLWVLTSDEKKMRQYDRFSRTLLKTVDLAEYFKDYNPSYLAVDPRSNKIYIASGYANLYQYDNERNSFRSLKSGEEGRYIRDLVVFNGMIYVLYNNQPGQQYYSLIEILSADGTPLKTFTNGALKGGIFVNAKGIYTFKDNNFILWSNPLAGEPAVLSQIGTKADPVGSYADHSGRYIYILFEHAVQLYDGL